MNSVDECLNDLTDMVFGYKSPYSQSPLELLLTFLYSDRRRINYPSTIGRDGGGFLTFFVFERNRERARENGERLRDVDRGTRGGA